MRLAVARSNAKAGPEPVQQALPYAEAPAEAKELAKQIVKKLRPDTPTPLDELLDSLPGVSASEAIAVLFELELMGTVRQLPGKSYVLVW